MCIKILYDLTWIRIEGVMEFDLKFMPFLNLGS